MLCYLGSIIHKHGQFEGGVNYRIKAGWMKWRSASRVMFDHRIPIMLKGNFYKTVIRPVMVYVIECWSMKKQRVHKRILVERRILKRISGNTGKYRI